MRRLGALAFICALATLGALACARSRAPISSEDHPDGAPPIDAEVMAYLSLARALHHEANLSEDARDLPGAIAPLERLVLEANPHEGTRVPEVEEVLADTYARLAELHLRAGDLETANENVKEGLPHSPDATYFRGHLLEVQGIIDERSASALADAGQVTAADRARANAREHLREAVLVQEQVLSRATADASREGGRR
jgi:hypothetical protein